VSVTGLWTAEFTTQTDRGTGVVVFVNGRILGGDNHYYYSGSYKEQGTQLEGSLLVKHYAGALANVFGPLRELRLTLVGSASNEYILAKGQDALLRPLSIKLQRVQQL
jgi:hypothetical protein